MQAGANDHPPGWGIDVEPAMRPGVPMVRPPRAAPGAHWGVVPERQERGAAVIDRSGMRRITPVFGTAQPARGASGWLRRRAYAIPEQYARHWMLLMVADRVEVLGTRMARRIPALVVGTFAVLAVIAGRKLREEVGGR